MSFHLTEVDATTLAIAEFDLIWCQRYLVAYLDLLKKPEEDDPWARIELGEAGARLNLLDILARSLVTSIVISYSRPWSGNRDVAGKSSKLPRAISKGMDAVKSERATDQPLLPFNQVVHKQVLLARNKFIAHSDHAKWEMQFTPSAHETKSAARDPFCYLSEAETRELLENTKSLRSEIAHEKNKARRHYHDAQRSGGADG